MIIELNNREKIRVRVIRNEGIYEYFVKNTRIGVYDPNVMEDNILILQNTLEDDISKQIKDQIDCVKKEDIVQEGEQNQKLQEYADKNSIEKIDDILIVDLEKENKEETLENEDEKEIEEQLDNEEELQNAKTTTDDINVKQEISLDERANDMQNLRKWLGENIPKEYTKMAVIESSQMDDIKDEDGKSYKSNSTRYSLALIDKDNNIVPLQKYIPNLRQRASSGTNPTELKYQIDKDGNVEKDAVLSEYEIGNKIFQIDNKEMGRIQVNIGQEEHGGNETIAMQMRDSNSMFATDTKTRSVIGEYESNGEYTVDENLKEARQHEKQNKDCDMTIEDIDGDLKTKSHNHLENIDFNRLAIKWGLYKDGVPDQEKAKEILEKEMKQNNDKSQDEIIEDITNQMEEDYRGEIENRK